MSRFTVCELWGYPVRARVRGHSGQAQPLLSCSVHDTALYGNPVVAIFNQEDVRGGRIGKGPLPAHERQEAIRNRAHGLASILEAEHSES